jgi:trehalose-phosphatase
MNLVLSGTPRVIMLDVDGTLAPIAPRPELAVVPAETRRTIEALIAQPGVIVCLVSGRAAIDAQRMVGVEGVWVIGNHGAEVMRPDGGIEVNPAVVPYGDALDRAAAALAPVVDAMPGAILEPKGWTLSVHYRAVDPAAAAGLARAVGNIAEREGLSVRDGKKVIEVRPPVSVDKGTAVLALARRLGALAPGASLLFAGDDVTDEDAFRALRANGSSAITIQVAPEGDGRSSAEYRVDDPAAMRALLAELAT